MTEVQNTKGSRNKVQKDHCIISTHKGDTGKKTNRTSEISIDASPNVSNTRLQVVNINARARDDGLDDVPAVVALSITGSLECERRSLEREADVESCQRGTEIRAETDRCETKGFKSI